MFIVENTVSKMLEYPEAVNVTKEMNKELIGKTIERISFANHEGLVKQGFIKIAPEEYDQRLKGKTITSAENKGKYFLVHLDPPEFIFFFVFETSGKVLYHKDHSTLPAKYTVKLTFTDTTMLTIRIIAWGTVLVETEEFYLNHPWIHFTGISPGDKDFTLKKFKELLSNHTKSIKTFFVGQKYVAGIGNGYLQDIFFKAGIHPKRKVPSLTDSEIESLYLSIQNVMKEATGLGGRDTEVNLYGEAGRYKPILDKRMKNQPCPNCNKLIEKLAVDGSSAYVCSNCQPL